MESLELNCGGRGIGPASDRPLALAVSALAQATPADALLAFSDAVEGFALRPSWLNARKVEAAMLALRHHEGRLDHLPAAAEPPAEEPVAC
jgi:hypothetical protein